jgi:hypothetical protein
VAAGRVHRSHYVSEAKINQIQTYDCHTALPIAKDGNQSLYYRHDLWLLTSQSLIHFILLNGKFNFWTLVGHPARMNINQQMIFDNNKRHQQQSIVKFRGSIFSNARTFFFVFLFSN